MIKSLPAIVAVALMLLSAACWGTEGDLGENSCRWAYDGACDEPAYCEYGTDTYECSGGTTSSGSTSFSCVTQAICTEYSGPASDIQALQGDCAYSVVEGHVCPGGGQCCMSTSGSLTQWIYWYDGQDIGSCASNNLSNCN